MSQTVQKNQVFHYKGTGIAPAFCRLSRRYLREPILDIGAGNGAILRELRERGHKLLYGIDLEPPRSQRFLVCPGDCTELAEFARWGLRTVICTDVIEHLPDEDVEQTFSEVWDVLPLGGHFIITTLNNEDLQANSVVCPDCCCEFHRNRHLQSFDREKLSCLLQLAGFRVVDYFCGNLTGLSMFPLLALYYCWPWHKEHPFLHKDLFIVARKEEKTFKSVFDD